MRGLKSLRAEIGKLRESKRLEETIGLSVGGSKRNKKKQEGGEDPLEGLAKRYDTLLELMGRDEVGRHQVKDLTLPPLPSAEDNAAPGGDDPLSDDQNTPAEVSFQLIPPTPSLEDHPTLFSNAAAADPGSSRSPAARDGEGGSRQQDVGGPLSASSPSQLQFSSSPFRDDPYDDDGDDQEDDADISSNGLVGGSRHTAKAQTRTAGWTTQPQRPRRYTDNYAEDEESAIGGGAGGGGGGVDDRDEVQLLQGQRSVMDGEFSRACCFRLTLWNSLFLAALSDTIQGGFRISCLFASFSA